MNWTRTRWIMELRTLYPDYEDFQSWFSTKHPQLNYRTPMRAIFMGDEYEVAKIVEQLVSGAYL